MRSSKIKWIFRIKYQTQSHRARLTKSFGSGKLQSRELKDIQMIHQLLVYTFMNHVKGQCDNYRMMNVIGRLTLTQQAKTAATMDIIK